MDDQLTTMGVICLSLSLMVLLRLKRGFPQMKIKVGVGALDIFALLPCRDFDFLYPQTQ